jgi:Ca2+-binding RTX toxin-like protein
MVKISGRHDNAYSIEGTGGTYIFTPSYFGSDPDGPAIDESGLKNRIVLHGTVESSAAGGGYSGLATSGAKANVLIAEDGIIRVEGYAILCSGAGSRVQNEGLLVGAIGYSTVYIDNTGIGSVFRNSGNIVSEGNGFYISAHQSKLVNDRHGSISTEGTAIFLGIGNVSTTLINEGRIVSDGYAVYGGDGKDLVRNSGVVIGNIMTGAGDDVIDLRRGTVHGEIAGADGADTYIIDNANMDIVAHAGQGSDTIKSSVSYVLPANIHTLVLLGKNDIIGAGNAGPNDLIGNSGNNRLEGGGSFDDLLGKGGNDRLFGGTGADVFRFKTGYDKDTIEDFNRAEGDLISISDWKSITSFNDLVNNHASNHGDDVWIDAGSDRLIIRNMLKADLEESDFFI